MCNWQSVGQHEDPSGLFRKQFRTKAIAIEAIQKTPSGIFQAFNRNFLYTSLPLKSLFWNPRKWNSTERKVKFNFKQIKTFLSLGRGKTCKILIKTCARFLFLRWRNFSWFHRFFRIAFSRCFALIILTTSWAESLKVDPSLIQVDF